MGAYLGSKERLLQLTRTRAVNLLQRILDQRNLPNKAHRVPNVAHLAPRSHSASAGFASLGLARSEQARMQ